MYPNTRLYIDGQWSDAGDGATLEVRNPATDEIIGQVARATRADLERAVAAAERGLAVWRATPALSRASVLRKAGHLLRERLDDIARLMTLEQGKALAEAKGEIDRGADTCEWMAGEASRLYGRSIPARAANVSQLVVREPIGIVAAFSPWNFPINQLVRKVLGALAAGCSIMVKAPEEAPACSAAMVQAFADAGVPAGVLNLVFGVPAEISGFLVPHPSVRKVSFTGSTAVGKQLAAEAARHMKVSTMELGGHAPVLVFADCDVEAAARALAGNKFRNAGQSCISPTRLLVERPAFERFVAAFVDGARAVKVGDGLDPATTMGPLANPRRLAAMRELTADAITHGAKLQLGGKRIGDKGNFFAPTVFTNVPLQARLMNEEPFGPLVPINAFDGFNEAIAEANRLPFGLSAYAFTASHKTAQAVAAQVQSGMVSVNHFGLGHPEAPFGGMKDSGYGFEGGAEAIEGYLQTRFITLADL
ncbi:MAG: NAD-dependent succinate-semialdehyde dehydrogenase [Rudaea sp.]|uniref:NAD-dependent succinate-semialdehyde dehydrogenase n=1 Tax=Rudaea sp. TaxID=2136325 RepID=UPI0039E615BA